MATFHAWEVPLHEVIAETLSRAVQGGIRKIQFAWSESGGGRILCDERLHNTFPDHVSAILAAALQLCKEEVYFSGLVGTIKLEVPGHEWVWVVRPVYGQGRDLEAEVIELTTRVKEKMEELVES